MSVSSLGSALKTGTSPQWELAGTWPFHEGYTNRDAEKERGRGSPGREGEVPNCPLRGRHILTEAHTEVLVQHRVLARSPREAVRC